MKRTLPVHPFLFALYSVLGPYSQNATQVPIDWSFRSLAVLLFFTTAIYLLLLQRFKNVERAGFVSSLVLIWLFMGHLYRLLLEGSSFWRSVPGGLIALLAISIPFAVLASGWTWVKITNKTLITAVMNGTSLILVIFPLLTIASILPEETRLVATVRMRQAQAGMPVADSSSLGPDIYVIIVDGYGRADFLQDTYGYDNSDFTGFLKEKGFYLAEHSTSNYPQTELSLSSLLNYRYLDEYVTGFGEASGRGPLRELLQHSTIRHFLEEEGYTFVALPSAALFAQIRDADIYLQRTPGDINEFEGMLMASSLVGVVVEAWVVPLPVPGYDMHRRDILFSLEHLAEASRIPGPKIVFAHILSPHPPFVFDAHGNPIAPDGPYSSWDGSLFPGAKEEYIPGYSDQITFINQKLKYVINAILENSSNLPVILLQGDHGPGAYYDMLKLNTSCLSERYSILNAYFFPDGDYRSLYPGITPVNSFRLILNKYFGARLALLEDRNYFAGWLSPYVFTDVTAEVSMECTSTVVGSP